MEKNPQEKYFIWFVQGGLGKNVAATALIKSIKKTYSDRKLIVVASWPEIFLNNPHIDRVYNASSTPYFYEDYIENKDIIICNQEPYNQTGHITNQKHLLENWCDLLNIEYTNQQPVLFYNYAQQKSYDQPLPPKPVLLIHTGGGPYNDNAPYNWTRDIPLEFAQNIVNHFSQEYNIVQITRPNGYKLTHPSVKVIDTKISNLNLFALLTSSSKRILIDSCLQHAAAAMNLPSTVLWIGTSPKIFGYKMHKNIKASQPQIANQLVDSITFNYQFSNNEYQCPYKSYDEIFPLEKITKL